MKHIKIISLLFLTALFGNSKAQTYNQPAEVISAGGGESSGGNYSNFGVLGETFVDYSVLGGNYNTSIGFLYASDTSGVVGIDENQLNSQNIKIFPNPNSGKFNIEMKTTEPQDIELKLFNSAGQQIYREYFGTVSPTLSGQAGTFQKTIDISNFANGIYTVQLITEKGTVNKQITVH